MIISLLSNILCCIPRSVVFVWIIWWINIIAIILEFIPYDSISFISYAAPNLENYRCAIWISFFNVYVNSIWNNKFGIVNRRLKVRNVTCCCDQFVSLSSHRDQMQICNKHQNTINKNIVNESQIPNWKKYFGVHITQMQPSLKILVQIIQDAVTRQYFIFAIWCQICINMSQYYLNIVSLPHSHKELKK